MRKMMDDLERENHSLINKVNLLTAELTMIRKRSEESVTMEDVQQLLANQGGGGKRGVYPSGKLNKNFDAQTAQIAANHPTYDLAKRKKAEPPVRKRARINT
jgi:hypothetical protein